MEKSNNINNSIVAKDIISTPTKETIKTIKEQILEGTVDPAYVGVVLKKFAKIAEEVNKDKQIKEIIEKETVKHQPGNTKTFTLYSAKITVASRGFWDYSKTNDPLLKRLQEIESTIQERIKQRKAELEMKSAVWETENKPRNVSAKEAFGVEDTATGIPSEEVAPNFGLRPFTVSWETLPELTWIEGYGETDTTPPIKRSTDQLRYSL